MPKKMMLPDHALKKLIKEVRNRECLWNPENERYNDRYQMAKSWMEVADALQLPEDRLRVKWKNLRDLFKKETKKFGSEKHYTGKWRYFHELEFLNRLDVSAQSNRVTNVETKEEVEEDQEFEFEVENEQETETNNEVEVYLDENYEEDPIPDKRPRLSTDEDYDVMFLKSLAPYFRQLDPLRKLVVRSKMQDMLLSEMAAQASANQFKCNKS